MSAADRVLFESVAGDLLAALGYETDGVQRRISLPERFAWNVHHKFWWLLWRLNRKDAHRWLLTDRQMRRARRRAGRRSR